MPPAEDFLRAAQRLHGYYLPPLAELSRLGDWYGLDAAGMEAALVAAQSQMRLGCIRSLRRAGGWVVWYFC